MSRVALLYDAPYPFVRGGGQKRLFEVATRLVARGWKIDWYALKFWTGEDNIQLGGINYIAVGPAVPFYTEAGKRSLKEALIYGLRFWNKVCLSHYDIIHAGQWPYFHLYPARFYACFGRAKLSIDWWEVWGEHWCQYTSKFAYLGKLLERLSSRLSKHIVAISQQGAEELAALGVAPNALNVIHNGIDYRFIRGIAPATDKFDYIYMGRLAAHKNIDKFIRAVKIMKDQGVTPAVAIIGEGSERKKLETLARSLGLDSSIKFYGLIQEDEVVFALLKSARYFVHPSTKEGGGSITTLEANACGLPVIAYRHPHGIAEEFINEGENGFWVGNFSIEALARKLIDVYGKTMDQSKILAGAEKFDWDNIAMQYHHYFKNLVS